MNIFRKKAKTGAAILSAAALLAGIFAGVPRGVTVANAADTADTAGTGSAVVYAGDSANDTTDQIITGDMLVSGINKPVPEEEFDRTGYVNNASAAAFEIKSINWYADNDDRIGRKIAENEVADYGTYYYIILELTAKDGYIFDKQKAAFQVDIGYWASPWRYDISDDQKNLVIKRRTQTVNDRLLSIEAPQPIQVEAGTAYEDMNLPEKVNITTKFNTRTTASVEWNTEYIKSGSYDPSILTEQTVTLRGRVTDVYSINVDNVWEYLELTINIKAADAAEAPTADITPGTYTENQSVILTSATEDAVIYYTTDGSEPALADGVPSGTTKQYTAPIAVKGEAGQSVETTIKAFAVKSGMNNSAVETFTYTIDIPAPVKKYTLTVVDGLGSGEYETNY